jgi:hypothetical protein
MASHTGSLQSCEAHVQLPPVSLPSIGHLRAGLNTGLTSGHCKPLRIPHSLSYTSSCPFCGFSLKHLKVEVQTERSLWGFRVGWVQQVCIAALSSACSPLGLKPLLKSLKSFPSQRINIPLSFHQTELRLRKSRLYYSCHKFHAEGTCSSVSQWLNVGLQQRKQGLNPGCIFCNLILFAIYTSTFSKLCKIHLALEHTTS